MDINALEEELKVRLVQLEGRLANLQRDATQEHSADSVEQAQERENDEVVDAIGVETRKAIADTRAAIQRIGDGNYGVCKGCGDEIAADRLLARPESTHCIKCAD